MAVVSSFIIAVVIGPQVIENLKIRQIGQMIREEGVKEHKKKSGIPTMGGIIFLIPIIITTLFYASLNVYVGLVLILTAGMGFLGMLDDLTKVIKARSLGLTAKQKLFGQLIFGLIAAIILLYSGNVRVEKLNLLSSVGRIETVRLNNSVINVPLFGVVDLNWFYLPFIAFVVTAFTNAVNLTDGLDGLAAGSVAIAVLPFLVISYICGNMIFSQHVQVPFIPGVGELAVVAGSIFGACLGFLWFNAHPAQVFMGDTGSMALGGAIAGLAISTRSELFSVVIGGLFVLEALSVIIQVAYFKYTNGKRIFKMSPIHHHFELSGWQEEKVVTRFWIVNLMLALTGLVLFAFRLIFK